MHTTNYFNTFIQIAEDSPAKEAEVPPATDKAPTVARLQFELMYDQPYTQTSDDILFEVYARKNNIAAKDRKAAREQFFSKGQPCLRASPLTKRYGWGVHSNAEGKVALIPAGTKEYAQFQTDKKQVQTKAMRSKRA